MAKTRNSAVVWIKRIAITMISIVLLVTAIIYWVLQGSLATLDGELRFADLNHGAVIERDAQGLVTIKSDSRTDMAFAMGFVHAQERFFQMDLLRRRGAGELSELFGSNALAIDKKSRVHRFRNRAKATMEGFPESQKQVFESYKNGVNAGLSALDSKPFEYQILRVDAEPWRIEDSLLTSYAMYFSLQTSNGRLEWQKFLLQQSLPAEITKFLLPLRSEWDAPIQLDDSIWQPQTIPEHSLKSNQTVSIQQHANQLEQQLFNEESSSFGIVGSNNWAVGGNITKSGAAMMADDMHLGLSVPNTWFRMRLIKSDGSLDVGGVTLPGGPLIIAGSNTYVAWGFTNTSGDWGDLIQLKINPDDDNQYLTKSGYQSFIHFNEVIKIKGGKTETLDVRETEWGPVVKGVSDDLMAFNWVAHYAQGMNGGLLQLENMRSVDQTLSIVDSIGMPAQNAMLADRFGNIAWTIFGAIPNRRNQSGNVDYTIPGDWSDGAHGWDGWLNSAQYPKTKNPKDYRLWTANGRVASGQDLALIGDGSYALGARAKQIRDGMFALNSEITEQDLLDIQLDDRAIFLMRWQELLLSVVQQSDNQDLKIFKTAIENWGARASVDSIGYRLVKEFRLATARKLFASITAPCKQQFENCNYYRATHLWEEPLWALVSARNTDWLPEGHQQWQSFFESLMLDSFKPVIDKDLLLKDYTWGNKNFLQIKHPLSQFVPGLSMLTDMPGRGYSGDRDMPKAATPRFGASERMVISPGHEKDAILHMPTSQAGHPLSPYFGVGHDDWVEGKPSPLLPGETVWTLRLEP